MTGQAEGTVSRGVQREEWAWGRAEAGTQVFAEKPQGSKELGRIFMIKGPKKF